MSNIKVGDELELNHWDETVKVVYVSPIGELVFQFSDGSIDVTNEKDMADAGLSIKKEEITINKYVPILRDKMGGEISMDDTLWDTPADIKEWWTDDDLFYEVIDIVEVNWTNKED